MVSLKKNSAFAKAVNDMLARVVKQFPETMDRPVKAIVAGGAAVHLYTGHRVSDDLDVEFTRRVLVPNDLVLSYQDESGAQRTLLFDSNYSPTLGLLHEDYIDDAVFVDHAGGDSRLQIYALSPIDLAVSKLSRFADNDRGDIRALAECGLITSDALRRRAVEALTAYIGNVRFVELNLDDALRIVQAAELQRSSAKRRSHDDDNGFCP